ncbi:MAG: type II toxin-antitoxin system RelE/ParE family toxin [Opitutaceae bacterium]|nr:type II toxin-antitoxin system RelE/ParE family toxin [Opitutaceae bacterium]
MIQSFGCTETERIFKGDYSRRLPTQIQAAARRKLRILHAVVKLEELRIPPANRLEALKGSRKGQHSIRINDQWRLCFTWTPSGPVDVEIVDYH